MALHGQWTSGRLQLYSGDYTAIDGLGVDFGNVDSGALLHGGGTGTYPLTNSVAAKNFLSYYVKSTATSGDARGLYMRLYIAGAAGAGEALRAFTTVSDVAAASAHGAHISLSFGSTGSITGAGVAARQTLQIPNGAMTAGTYTASQAEIWSDGSSSDPTGVTELALFRAVLSGNATGIGKVDDKAALFAIDGGGIGAGNIVAAKSSAAVTHTARITINGVVYYLMLSNVQ